MGVVVVRCIGAVLARCRRAGAVPVGRAGQAPYHHHHQASLKICTVFIEQTFVLQYICEISMLPFQICILLHAMAVLSVLYTNLGQKMSE